MNNFEKYSSGVKKRLARVDEKKAKAYQHRIGYLGSTVTLPDYYRASGFEDMQLQAIDFKDKALQPKRTKSIKLVTPKGKMAWRQFGLMHPYSYWHLCEEISTPDGWKQIRSLLCEDVGVSSYSIPPLYTSQQPKGAGIAAWKNLSQGDLLIDLSEKRYCASTDISNFYPSIYTHSIAWAAEGKEEARADRHKQSLLGSHLDKLFQNSRDGQTNGILVGSVLSDIVAELVLSRIDKKLSENFKIQNLDLIAVRYRDDYKFLCKSRSDAEKALKIFSRTISVEYDLTMNEKKTQIDDDVILGALRPWDLEMKSSGIISKLFDPNFRKYSSSIIRDILLAAYELQARYPESRVGISVINRLAKKIEHNKKFTINTEAAEKLIPLIRKFVILREDVTPNAMLLIDQLLKFVPEARREILLKNLCKQHLGSDDNDYQEIWLYRVCLHHAPNLLDELFGKSNNPFILAITGDMPHYELFETVDAFNTADIKELEKFSLIDSKLLQKAKAEPISPASIDIFRY